MMHCEGMKKFSSQARPELLEEVRSLAAEDGRQLQSVIEEALSDWVIRRKRQTLPRPEVIAYARTSIARHRDLYRKLAE